MLQRTSSEADRDIEEEDALLTGARTGRAAEVDDASHRSRRWREIGLFTWACLATIVVVILAVVYQKQTPTTPASDGGAGKKPEGKRNLIFMVSDGMGPTSLSLTRSFMQEADGLPWGEHLVIEPYMIGQSRTRSTSSLVTDSAAGATAFSCGKKSYNGAISVLPDHSPCGSVMEAAKRAGYMTGLVVTTRITDATPAVFAAHVNMRSEEDRIAEQLIGQGPLGRSVDIMLGGGRCHFLSNETDNSCRQNSRDVISDAKKAGWNYIDNRQDFDGLRFGSSVEMPLLGLFADHDIPYEVDRRFQEDTYPSLEEMADMAIRALSAATKDNGKGFFLMIEGSRIDHAGHANDPVAQVHEVLAYDKAVSTVIDFVDKSETPTVMVSTSDHETGGLAVARRKSPHLHYAYSANVMSELHFSYPEYRWFPSVLANASRSAEYLSHEYYLKRQETSDKNELRHWISATLKQDLGVNDFSDDEVDLLLDKADIAPYTFADIISRRAQTGWSTHGHSAADVNIYAHPLKYACPQLQGNHENTEVGEFLRDYLDVDVDAITKELKEKSQAWDMADPTGSWMGDLPAVGERLDGQDHIDHYQGDFKKHKRCQICGV